MTLLRNIQEPHFEKHCTPLLTTVDKMWSQFSKLHWRNKWITKVWGHPPCHQSGSWTCEPRKEGEGEHFSALGHGFLIYKAQVLNVWISNFPLNSDILRHRKRVGNAKYGFLPHCVRRTLPKVPRLWIHMNKSTKSGAFWNLLVLSKYCKKLHLRQWGPFWNLASLP